MYTQEAPNSDEDFFVKLENHKPKSGILDKVHRIIAAGRFEVIPVQMSYDVAMDLLTMNKGNRWPSKINIHRIAEDMLNDKWEDYVDDFVITDDEGLKNGQKRSMAFLSVIKQKPDFTFKIYIKVGQPRRIASKLDTNQVRSLADTLKDEGYNNVYSLAKAVRMTYYMEEFNRLGGSIDRTQKMRNDQIVQWMSNKKNAAIIQELVKRAQSYIKVMKFVSVSGYAAVWYLLHKKDKNQAEEFMSKLATGEDINTRLVLDHNVTMLRNKLAILDRKEEKRRASARDDERYRYIIFAWNMTRWSTKINGITGLKPDFSTPNIEMPV